MDVRDPGIERFFREFAPEVVNHHAAQHSVAISVRDPRLDADVNVMGLINVLDNSVKHGVRKVDVYKRQRRKRFAYETEPSAMPKRCSIARPSNQCRYRSGPTSKRPGPLRSRVPASHEGSVPWSGRAATSVSRSSVVKPRR